MTRQTWHNMLFAGVTMASLIPTAVSSQGSSPPGDSYASLHSVFLEDLTWMDVRDAIATGYSTVIVPIGGIEQNGPYLAVGKHNFVVRGIAEATARNLGDAIVAPIVPIGPGGNIDPPSGHMRWPGSLSVRREILQELLVDIGNSLRHAGFLDVVFISEHEGYSSPESPGPVAETVARLNQSWRSGQTRAHFIPEYRANLTADGHASSFQRDVLGVVEEPDRSRAVSARALIGAPEVPESGDYLRDGRNPDGTHEGFYYSAVTMAVNPGAVRVAERIAAGPQATYGVDWKSPEQLAANGRKLIEYRARGTADHIRAAIGNRQGAVRHPSPL
jgi:creatinine amidohydrolase/Fe(II)-dependent formamide hydrolase-like protein